MKASGTLLLDHRCWDERPSGDGPGVYAYFLTQPDALAPIRTVLSEAIYVGMTEGSLDARCHFDHPHSGFSTLRRSIGAILKDRLGLRAIPRAPGPSRTNCSQYRFTLEGEARLTEWMRQNLRYSHVPFQADCRDEERALIKDWRPPLNLTGWANPQRALLRTLRRSCASEAHAARPVLA
jgi:hypothetical protein